jgi:altronate hydrolase
MKRKILHIEPEDNTATALCDLSRGETVTVHGSAVVLKSDIPFGHKFALSDIPEGGQIIKYGEVIGEATKAILMGEHVHVHNVVDVTDKFVFERRQD